MTTPSKPSWSRSSPLTMAAENAACFFEPSVGYPAVETIIIFTPAAIAPLNG